MPVPPILLQSAVPQAMIKGRFEKQNHNSTKSVYGKGDLKKQKLLKVPNSFTTKRAISPYKNIPFFTA